MKSRTERQDHEYRGHNPALEIAGVRGQLKCQFCHRVFETLPALLCTRKQRIGKRLKNYESAIRPLRELSQSAGLDRVSKLALATIDALEGGHSCSGSPTVACPLVASQDAGVIQTLPDETVDWKADTSRWCWCESTPKTHSIDCAMRFPCRLFSRGLACVATPEPFDQPQ